MLYEVIIANGYLPVLECGSHTTSSQAIRGRTMAITLESSKRRQFRQFKSYQNWSWSSMDWPHIGSRWNECKSDLVSVWRPGIPSGSLISFHGAFFRANFFSLSMELPFEHPFVLSFKRSFFHGAFSLLNILPFFRSNFSLSFRRNFYLSNILPFFRSNFLSNLPSNFPHLG